MKLLLPLALLTSLPAMATTVNPVPEPSTISLVALGAAAGLFLAWRNKRAVKK